jgi:hypothetical protein
MVRQAHHEQYSSIVISGTCPFALSLSKGSDYIATRSLAGEGQGEGARVMLEIITLVEFIVAFLMGLAACCFLFWGILGGAFNNVENIKHRILEIEKDER